MQTEIEKKAVEWCSSKSGYATDQHTAYLAGASEMREQMKPVVEALRELLANPLADEVCHFRGPDGENEVEAFRSDALNERIEAARTALATLQP